MYMKKEIKLLLLGLLLVFTILPLTLASTNYVKGYVLDADDGISSNGMIIKATNELGRIEYDVIGINGKSRNYNQYQFSLQGKLTIKVIQTNDYYSDEISFKTTNNKYDFVQEIKLKKTSSFEKLGYEPFIISERTEYGFDKNTIYVDITNNLPTDETVNVYHIFNKNHLTEQINYNSIEILEEIDVEIFEEVITEVEVFFKEEIDVEIVINQTIIDEKEEKEIDQKEIETEKEMKFYDKNNNELDALKIKNKTIINNETNETTVIQVEETKNKVLRGYEKKNKFNDKTIETLFRVSRPVSTKHKQEYKHSQEEIEIKTNETIHLRLTYLHAPNFRENIPTYEQNKYDIVVCTINKEFCTILDPLWYNQSWDYYKEYTNLTGNITYMVINKTGNDASGFVDTRFVSCTNESLVFNHTLEATFDGQALAYNSSISPFAINLTLYYKMDESTGNLVDEVGNNDITEHGTVSSQSGKINNSRGTYSGSNYFGGSSITDWAIGTDVPFVVNVWINGTTSASNQDIIVFDSPDTTNDMHNYFRIDVSGHPTVYSGYRGTTTISYSHTGIVPSNEWTMLTFIYDSDRKISMCINGKNCEKSSNAHDSGSDKDSNRITIGAYPGGGQPATNYYIDEAGFWKGVILSQTEIFELYNGTKGQFRVNNLAENCTLRYYGNSEATSTSSASNTYFNPIASYYLDDNGGALDYSGNGKHLSIIGTISSQIGKINNSRGAFPTDNTNYLLNTDVATFGYSNDVSVSGFIYLNSLISSEEALLSFGGKDTNDARFQISIDANEKVNWYFEKNQVAVVGRVVGATTINTGEWYHFAGTYDGTTKEMTLYLNGEDDGSLTASGSGITDDTSFMIGGALYGASGNIKVIPATNTYGDEIYLYDKILTQDQIIQLYTQTSPNFIEGNETSQSVDIEVTTPLWETQSGQTSGNLTFLQTTKYINTTSISNVSYMTLTITDPDSTDRLTENMTNSSLSDWYSDTEFSFDKVGTWTIQVEGFKDGSSQTNSTTGTVEITSVSTKDGWYGCSKDRILTSGEIDALVTFDCDLVELSENATDYKTNNETLKTSINDSRNRNIKTGINIVLDFDLNSTSEKDSALTDVSNVLSDFTLPPYTDAIEYISLEIKNPENYNTSIKNSVINEFAENLTSTVENQFVIYSKNYNNVSLDSSYISFTSFFYLDNNTQSSLMQQENIILRNNIGLNRIYISLNDTLMLQTQTYQNNILDNLRGSPTGSTTIPTSNVAEINSDINDIVIFNNQSTEQQFTINVTTIVEMLTKDVWDAIKGYLIEKDTDGLFNSNVSNYSATNLFIDDFSHIQYGNTESTLFKESVSVGGHSNYTTNTSRDDLWSLYGANDAAIEIWDSSYKSNTFITYYGWFNVSSVSNWSRYDIIIFDDENPTELASVLSKTEATGTKLFGYIAVSDYNNTQDWIDAKKVEIDSLLALNDSDRLHIFIDGLDCGVPGENFSARMKVLVDYIKIENNKDIGLNTYTAYQDFCSWSKPNGFCMRESCVRRWDGTVDVPTYSWENWTLELEKSEWFNSHGVQVVCQSFENRTTDGSFRLENHTTIQNVYFASLVLGYTDFYLSQPDFQHAHEINLYDVGSDLSNAYSTDDDETYYRRYSNGIVYYNMSSHEGWIEDGREFDGITMCFNLIDSSDAVDAEATNFGFRVNGGSMYQIPATEIVWSSGGNWYCKDINSTDYAEDGYYFITMRPHDRNPTSGNAINIDNSINQENTGRHSYWDNLAAGYFSWNIYEQDKNWMVDVEINQTKSTSSDTTEVITQTNETSNYLTNLTLNSTYSQDIEVRSAFVEHDMTEYKNLTYWNGTERILLYPENNTDCSEISPTFNSTTIAGEIHKSCISNSGFRVATPSLSTQIYILDFTPEDTLAPLLEILYPDSTNYNAQDYPTQLNYSVNDTHDNLDSCWYNTGSSNISVSCGTNITDLNISQGSNTWTVYANDTYGNLNISSVTFNVDSILPNLTINLPLNTSYATTNMTFNLTAIDTNIDTCFYSLDELNNITLTQSSDGSESLILNITPESGDSGAVSGSYGSWQKFIIGENTENKSIQLNKTYFRLRAPSSITGNLYAYIISGDFPNGTIVSNGSLDLSTIGTSFSNYNISMESVTLEKGTSYVIAFNHTASNTMYRPYQDSGGSGYLEGGYFANQSTFTDFSGVNWSMGIYGTTESSNIYTDINSSMTEGSHNVIFYCNDTYGNLASSLSLFSISIGDPIITIINPIFEEDEKIQPVEFIVNLSRTGTCDMNIYGTNISMTTTDNILFRYSKVIEVGLNTVVFYCNDTIGNSANASTDFYMYPSSTGGANGNGADIIYEIPEEPEIEEVEEIVIDKKTTIQTVVEDIGESIDNIKENAEENYFWYIIGAILLIILILVLIFI